MHCQPLATLQVGTEELRWRMARRAVAGRLVNCYTRKVRGARKQAGRGDYDGCDV